MSNLTVNISSATSYVTQPATSISVEGDLNIQRIVDIPGQKKVIAFVENIGQIDLDELSGDNYDTPAEWTNADVVTAVKNVITA
jgi:hypothetical protein